MAKSETKCRWLERRHPRLKKASEFSARIKWIWRTSGKLAEGDYAASLQIVQHAYNRCLTHRGAYSTSKAINAAAGCERDGKKVRKAMTIASAGGNCFHDKAAVTSSGRFVLSPLCSTLRACNLLEASPPTMIEWPSVKARASNGRRSTCVWEKVQKCLSTLKCPFDYGSRSPCGSHRH